MDIDIYVYNCKGITAKKFSFGPRWYGHKTLWTLILMSLTSKVISAKKIVAMDPTDIDINCYEH